MRDFLKGEGFSSTEKEMINKDSLSAEGPFPDTCLTQEHVRVEVVWPTVKCVSLEGFLLFFYFSLYFLLYLTMVQFIS